MNKLQQAATVFKPLWQGHAIQVIILGIQVVNAFEALTAYELTDENGETHLFKTGKLALDEYNHRAERLKENLQWAKNIRKMKIQERQVPEDFWNGIEMA